MAKQPALPQSAANTVAPVSTYQEGTTVAMGWGRDVFGSQWLCQPYSWRTAYGGANKPEWQYCSIAAAYREGPIDFVGKVFFDNKQIANWDHTFSPGEETVEFIINPTPALGQAVKAIVHRGGETGVPSAGLIAGTGQNHPAYRGTAWIEWINLDLGQGNTSLPSITVEMGLHAPAIGAFTGGDSHPYGVNPIAALYAVLTDTKGGLNSAAGLLDPGHWGDQANALQSVGISGRTGNLVHCHPCWKTAKDAGALLSELLAYFDGYVYADADQLKIGWFPNQDVDPSTLTEITEDDLKNAPSGPGFPDWNQSPSSVVVLYRSFDRDYQDSPAIMPAPANRESGASPVPVRNDRPFCHAADQAMMMAAEISVAPVDDITVSLTAKKSRANAPGGAPLVSGDLFNWDYNPWTLDLVCRVVARRLTLGQPFDTLEVIRERGQYPRPYVAPVDARVLPTPVDPGVISTADVRLLMLPNGFGTGRQVAALVNRVQKEIIGAQLFLSPSGSAPWEQILEQRYFSAKCAVNNAAITDISATVRVSSSSVDFARFAAQSTVNQTDDTLLLLIGDEMMSVGSITVVSAGVYDLSILRGRQGSVAAGHAIADVCWLFFRAELRAAVHNEFYNVRNGSNVYDATIATKHFKIALFTINQVGLAKPDDPGISLQLPDLTADGLSGYTILLTKEAQTVACDSAGTVASGQLGATGVAKTDIVVLRGSTLLSPVASAPGLGQFAIALGTLTSVTATKEDNDTVRADTLTADTGVIEITVSVDGAFSVVKKYTLTKAKSGAAGGTGATGATGNHVERRYKGSDIVPSTPTGDSPSGWTIAPPTTFTGAIFYVEGTKDPADHLVGTWSTPVRLSGTVVWYPVGDPTTQLAGKAVMPGDGAYDISTAGKNKYWRFDGTNWVDTQKILEAADFGTGVKPIETFSSLPAAGDAGRVVFLTSDHKLYRDTGSAWTVATDGADITANSIVAGTLQAGSVSATEVGTNLLVAHSSNIGTAVINDGHISSLDAGKITTGSLTAGVSISSGGFIEAGSGDNYFKVDGSVLQYGNFTFTNYSGLGNELDINVGVHQVSLFSGTTGAGILVQNNFTSKAASLSDDGGVRGDYIEAGVSGFASASGGITVAGAGTFGGDVTAPNGNFGALNRNDGDWTTPMWDGSNWLQFQWASGLRFRVDFSTEGGISTF